MSRVHRTIARSRAAKTLALVAALAAAGICQTRTADVNYAGDGKAFHNLDIYIPTKTADKYPVVIDIYGSAWMSNNGKGSSPSPLGSALLKAGYAVVNPNHRSSSDAKFPAQIQDIKAVVRFVRGNAAKYKFDTTFIGITGQSSGGHLTALTATSGGVTTKTVGSATADIEGTLGSFTSFGSSVHAAADWFGPTDFSKMDSCGSSMDHNGTSSPEGMLIGGVIKDNKDKVALANPITYIDAKDPPFVIYHGTADQTVPPCESVFLDRALTAAGVPSKLTLVSGGGHGTGTTVEPYIGQMVTFFNETKTANTTGTVWRSRASQMRVPAGTFDALGRACRESLRDPVSSIPRSLGVPVTIP